MDSEVTVDLIQFTLTHNAHKVRTWCCNAIVNFKLRQAVATNSRNAVYRHEEPLQVRKDSDDGV
jgi:hypothetical protein